MLNFYSSRLSWWWWCVCVWWVAGWAAKVFAVTAAVVSCHSCDVVFSAPPPPCGAFHTGSSSMGEDKRGRGE